MQVDKTIKTNPFICTEDNGNIINPALIIIPDIGGFTKFMSEADLVHSQAKIAQLLETILYNNILGLKVSEIEGDAILFYDFNNKVFMSEVFEQCTLMHRRFHEKLKEFDESGCHCGSCSLLQSLTIKFIVHYGNLGSVMVKKYCKLFGRDLIIAHRLLKNDIPVKEYLLLTEDFLNNYFEKRKEYILKSDDMEKASMVIDNIGLVKFSYKRLISKGRK